MQQLIILRHAEAADWQPGGDDFSRPLAAAGSKHAHAIARFFSTELDLPTEIVCSPAQRTRETLTPLLALHADLESTTRFLPQLYNARTETMISILDFAFASQDRVLVVAHNPGAEILASTISRTKEGQWGPGFPPGTLAVFDFESGWEAGLASGRLIRRVTRSDLSVD